MCSRSEICWDLLSWFSWPMSTPGSKNTCGSLKSLSTSLYTRKASQKKNESVIQFHNGFTLHPPQQVSREGPPSSKMLKSWPSWMPGWWPSMEWPRSSTKSPGRCIDRQSKQVERWEQNDMGWSYHQSFYFCDLILAEYGRVLVHGRVM